ncbi:hypothetical protein L195_g046169 [Trifolium pratense]|uniref:Uncharacterized protein n=1 Tax=Trifolium pratense TaxID=57577 RepID=A0A2K3MGY3_TRIPR|nr:hypothetical protein L195_g040749 [Trifolium pratense]PNX90046.1 hypothetical protein L195_g046169 [Trifolium pratense]
MDHITVPKDSGGLGIRKLEAVNKACLLKLNWKLKENSDELWIDAWSEAWIEAGLLLEEITDIPENMRDWKVHELVDNEGKWNLNILANLIPADILMKIAAIIPPKDEYGNDERVGIGRNNCGFSVAGMYNNICGHHEVEDNNMWRKAWRLKVPERVRL